MRKILASSLLWLSVFAALAHAQVGEKVLAGSEKIEPTKEMIEFGSRYMAVINKKSMVDYVALMHPASQECYKKSKHPEYYTQEIEGWFGKVPLQTLKEVRKFKSTYDFEFYKVMTFPRNPTHIFIFEGLAQSGKKVQSAEIIEENARFSLAYRCM